MPEKNKLQELLYKAESRVRTIKSAIEAAERLQEPLQTEFIDSIIRGLELLDAEHHCTNRTSKHCSCDCGNDAHFLCQDGEK